MNKLARGLILNMACTGMVPTRAMSPHVPLNHAEIIDDVGRAMELGVQMVHLHARDTAGVPTSEPEPFGRLIESIRELPGGQDLLVCVTTSGRTNPDFENRSRVLDLDGKMKPDMASLTLSSLNFADSASVNAPETIRKLAHKMQARGIRPELEVFDLGMSSFMNVLNSEGVLPEVKYVNVLLGNIAGAQVTFSHLAALWSDMPAGSVCSLAGIGRHQLAANLLGLVMADGVRVGLEDNLWFDHGRKDAATNVRLIARLVYVAQAVQRSLATRAEVRQLLMTGTG